MTRKTIPESSDKIKREGLTQKSLKEIMHYDPHTGEFTWIVDMGCARVGNLAGCENYGFIRIGIDNKVYPVAELAFLYMIGLFPKQPVKYLNGNKCDTRWSNINHGVHSLNYQKPQKPQQSEIPPEYRETAKLVLNLFQGAL